MGEMAPSATDFPLLFKVIDARSRLSVQVHPSETTCPFTGGEPKTEMWRVISGSGPIFAGLKPGTTQDVVAGNVLKGGFEESLVRHQARPGLTLFIPGGLVHAIGEDVVLYEVQQSSNTTFRLYDWGRVDAGGKPRELHVDSALKAIDYALPPPEPRDSVVCPFFSFRAIEARGNVKVPARADSFTALYIVEERRSVLVPANCAAVIPARGTVFATTLGD
jgi:mannose-6-phosphate isomerase